ncbi:Fis family transcriptional regulator [Magnetococcales bacterium HHB-1]
MTHIGSSLQSFLEEEGMAQDVRRGALKQLLILQIQDQMNALNLDVDQLAQRMDSKRVDVENLMDPDNHTVTLHLLEKAAQALGKELVVEFS